MYKHDLRYKKLYDRIKSKDFKKFISISYMDLNYNNLVELIIIHRKTFNLKVRVK